MAYNNISDLSQVSMLECLEVLDLEGNDVDDLVQVQYLGLCSQLRTLTLEGNPVCSCPRPGATEVKQEGVRETILLFCCLWLQSLLLPQPVVVGVNYFSSCLASIASLQTDSDLR